MSSEFGKGFIYNLILFSKHFYKNYESCDSWLWFNGAGDHFFELEIPEQFKNKNWAKRLRRLQSRILDNRLKFGKDEDGEKKEVFDELEKIVMLIDKDLGVKDIKADYN